MNRRDELAFHRLARREPPEPKCNPEVLVERLRRRHDERAAALGAPWQEWKAYYDQREARRHAQAGG